LRITSGSLVVENTAYIALSRQVVLRRELEVIANNVANLSTPAYKAKSVSFASTIQQVPGPDIAFVADEAVRRDFDQGPLLVTGNALDVAVQGEGFFPVETPDGVRYTRAGRFLVDADSQLVTSQGFAVLGFGGQPVTIPFDDGDIVVARDGTISTASGTVGRLEAVTFADLEALTEEGNALYATEMEPTPSPDAEFEQGMVEEANVNGVLEMTKMIEVSRSYQSAQRLIDTEFELQRKAISTIIASA
jgi:flagellar basal-body rod protein FlgF